MIKVSVRWHDGYLEEFECTEVRFGSDLLWMRLANGQNRHIPMRSVRWFSQSPESHAALDMLREYLKTATPACTWVRHTDASGRREWRSACGQASSKSKPTEGTKCGGCGAIKHVGKDLS